jgi:hypothetical protein
VLTPDQLSNTLYEVSLAGFQLVPESDGESGNSYALCDGNAALASGPTMEDALEEYFNTRL